VASVLNDDTVGSNVRFAEANSITFSGSGSAAPAAADAQLDEISGEFDGQIEDLKKKLRTATAELKETEKVARKLPEIKAQIRQLEEQKEHLEKEKEKAILEAKLQKQMKDLAEINRMSRSLRTKFSELKRTQQLIKTRMTGTRSSLNQLENEPPLDLGAIKDAANRLGKEMDAMHAAQSRILTGTHKDAANEVKATIKNANQINQAITSTLKKEVKSLAKKA
jgi:DNA repair exonuclease SbcCD ATPase subunit